MSEGTPSQTSRARQTPQTSRSLQSSGRPMVASIESPDISQRTTSFSQAPLSPSVPPFRPPESPHTSIDSRAPKATKVAIPRLKRSEGSVGDPGARTGGRHRVTHACEPCRHRKTKCSGERPVCRHCQDFKIACYYADGKRDRAKKQFGSMTEKVADYEKFLRDLMNRVSEEDAAAIRALLEKEASGEIPADAERESNAPAEADAASDSGEEFVASAGQGSTGALDRTEEDFTREGARQAGFMGKNSEVTWLQRLRQEVEYGSPDTASEAAAFEQRAGGARPLGADPGEGDIPLSEAVEGFTVQDSTYHLDDLTMSIFEAVEPYEMPTAETATHLFTAYMTRVHPTFPVVGKANMSVQFQKFVSGQIRNPPPQWLAILNLIFAIAAKYSHLIQAEWKGDERDHIIYFSRARILAMNGDSIFNLPDLQQIQVMGLMAFYFLCISQINRAWNLTGMAIRSATALGLNMRNESAKLVDHLKEIRYRMWWALYTMEHRLCSMTGRTNCILDEHCTTPLPVPLDEDQFHSEGGKALLKKEMQKGERNPASTPASASSSTPSTDRSRSLSKPESSRSPSMQQPQPDMEWTRNVTPNASLYFLHLVQLTRVSQSIFHRLYNPTTVTGSWSDIQGMISELDNSVESWYRGLPSVFDFKRKHRVRDFYDFRISLGFFYYGTKITISRPCVCRLDRKMPGQSSKSSEFNRTQAAKCIESAQDMLALIPDVPNAVGLNSVGPWFSILHFLVQAASVLMLEMSFRAHHMPEEAENIFEASKKAVRWIYELAGENYAAKRAWALCNSLLRGSAAKIGREVTDLPDIPPHARENLSSPGHSDVTMTSNLFSDTFAQSGLPAMAFTTAQGMPDLHSYSTFDPLTQYDQYWPMMGGSNDPMHYSQTGPGDIDFLGNPFPDDGHTNLQGDQVQRRRN